MDRVLIASDDIQYVSHLEMTLRKVGFEVESITNEYNLPEKILSFNPDYLIAKGDSTRVSSQSIGKKLKENSKFAGKIILVFSETHQSNPDDFIKLRMDLLLFEPIGAMKLVSQLLSLTQFDREVMMDRLLRFAQTDGTFRNFENQVLKKTGQTVDSEIQIISSLLQPQQKEADEPKMSESDVLGFTQAKVTGRAATESNPMILKSPSEVKASEDLVLSEEYKNSLKNELDSLSGELPLRIDSYNQSIKDINQDLKKGLGKKITKAANKVMFQEYSPEELKLQDEERKKFAKALLKK